MKSISKDKTGAHRYLRLFMFAIFAMLVAYPVFNTGLAWLYIFALTHPGCSINPKPIQDLPAPEEHQIHTHDGLTMRVWYYPSQNGVAVLALGGMRGSLGESLPPVSFLVRQGYGVLQIDGRSCARPPALVTLGYDEVQDAAAGLEFLLSQPEITRVGAIGFSMGGVTVIRTAARHPEITTIVAEGGYYNLGNHLVKPYDSHSVPRQIFLYTVAGMYWLQTGVTPWKSSPIDDIPSISPRPVLLIYGENELYNGRGDLQYEAAREPKELWIVPGGNHGTNHQVAPEEYERRVLDFFDQTLKNP